MLVWRAPERKWHAFVNKCFFGERRRLKSLCRSHCINQAGYPCQCALNETHNVKKNKSSFISYLLNTAAWPHWELLLSHWNSNPSTFTLRHFVWIITLPMAWTGLISVRQKSSNTRQMKYLSVTVYFRHMTLSSFSFNESCVHSDD